LFIKIHFNNIIYILIFILFIYIEPWEHLAYGAIFGYLGYNIPTWEDNLMIRVNEERVKRGYLPIERIHIIPTFGEGPISFEDKKTAPHN